MIYGNDQSYLKLGVFASSNTRQVECFRQIRNPPAGQANYGSIPLGPPGDYAWMRRAMRTVSGHGQYTAHSSQDGINSVRGGTWNAVLGVNAQIDSVLRITPNWNGKLMFRQVRHALAPPGHGAADREIKNTSARCQLRKSVLATTMCVALTLGPAARGQEAASEKAGPKNQQSGMGGGASTGGAHAPVKDALSRPITAGGFVDGAPIVFADITHQAGLDKFHHRSGSYEKNSILETPGSGVALLDYDNDGPCYVLFGGADTPEFFVS